MCKYNESPSLSLSSARSRAVHDASNPNPQQDGRWWPTTAKCNAYSHHSLCPIGVCKVNKKVRRPIKRSADDTGRVMRARPLARKRRHAPAPSRVPPHGSCPGAARSVCSGPIDRPEHARGQAKVTSQSRKKLAKGPHGTVVGVWALDGG
jgi:hypothetical protein